MNCKNRRDKCARPDSASAARTARHLREQEKKKNCGRAVQQDIHKMMRTRLQSEKLTVQHVRHRRERMPIMGMDMGECPGNAVPAQTAMNLIVFADVNRIIEVDEFMAEGLAENRPRNRD